MSSRSRSGRRVRRAALPAVLAVAVLGASAAAPAPSDGSAAAPSGLLPTIEERFWNGDVERRGSSQPPWWNEVSVRLGPEVGEDPATRIDFVRAAYSEKDRPRQAVKLLVELTEELRESHPRLWLRACYDVAHLYEASLQDFSRALGWYLRCGRFPLDEPAEARQNRIAAGYGAARAVEGLGEGSAAVGLYRALARDLRQSPDPYGDMVLPQVLLEIADAARAAGDAEAAAAAYRETVAAAERLPAGVPMHFRAPMSAARAELRRIDAEGLAFDEVTDGSYRGQAFGYNAPVEVRLRFEEGRLSALHVTSMGDKRPLDAYELLPDRILERQSLEVDAVTGATVTSRAIVSAATEAAFEGMGSRNGDDGERRAARPGGAVSAVLGTSGGPGGR